MKAAFIHDHNFVFNSTDNLYYDGSGGAFNKNLWNRYLAIFDSLIVVGRKVRETSNKLVISSSENVSFSLIDDIHGIKNMILNKKKVTEHLTQIIGSVDFVIIRLPSTLGKWAFQICKEMDKKYVLEVVGDPFEAYRFHGSLLGKLVAPVEYLRFKSIISNAKNVIYVTQNKLQERYPCGNNSTEISNVRLIDQSSIKDVQNYYITNNEKLTIGLIGTFHVKYKGHKEALLALKKLIDEGYNNILLNLVGTGDSEWVKDLAFKIGVEKNINIIGTLNSGNDGIIPFLDSLDIYIHPSRTEGLPRVLIEAMSRGKICLGSDVGGNKELLDSEFIHDSGDWKKLAQHIKNIINLKNQKKLEIALSNLDKSSNYLEYNLQNKRIKFLKGIVEENL